MELEQEVIVDQGAPAAEARAHNPTNPITDPSSQLDEPEVKEEKPEEPAIPKGVQKRIDRAVRQKYEAEARTKMLEERLQALESRQNQPSAPKVVDNGVPKIENFDNFDEYVAAKAEYIASKKIQETLSERDNARKAEYEAAERQKTADSWTKRLASATAELPDFEDVLASSDVPMSAPMQEAIMESDIGPRLAYYLAQNPEEAIQIAGMSPVAAIRTLGRIEERLTSQKPATPKVAPAPIKPVGGRAAVAKDPGKMSDVEYAKWRKSAAA